MDALRPLRRVHTEGGEDHWAVETDVVGRKKTCISGRSVSSAKIVVFL